mmetsp:Transcript_494/g.1442  ORF Transcript_494/g.1442 Transcript_494/m.1442 type:complete len:253 (+) Transcript_494:402-1160(+)
MLKLRVRVLKFTSLQAGIGLQILIHSFLFFKRMGRMLEVGFQRGQFAVKLVDCVLLRVELFFQQCLALNGSVHLTMCFGFQLCAALKFVFETALQFHMFTIERFKLNDAVILFLEISGVHLNFLLELGQCGVLGAELALETRHACSERVGLFFVHLGHFESSFNLFTRLCQFSTHGAFHTFKFLNSSIKHIAFGFATLPLALLAFHLTVVVFSQHLVVCCILLTLAESITKRTQILFKRVSTLLKTKGGLLL